MAKSEALYRLWDAGQRHLAAGRYIAARTDLKRAEALAWRWRDAEALSRLYLPLLETRRLIRYRAAEGAILIGAPGDGPREAQRLVSELLRADAGTLLLTARTGRGIRCAVNLAHAVGHASRRSGHEYEVLLLLTDARSRHVATPHETSMAGALPVETGRDATSRVGSSTAPDLVIPLPPAGTYSGGGPGPGALARESILVAWEALALRWQRRHALVHPGNPWEELAWLRAALDIDPACEPITMRLMGLAAGIRPTC